MIVRMRWGYHGACFLQRSGRKFPLALMHYVGICSRAHGGLALLSDANVGVLGLTSCECSVGSLCWLILLTVWDETLGLRFVFWTPSAHLHSA